MSYHRVGTEEEYNGLLITRVRRKPVDFWVEGSDSQGRLIKVVLRKQPKGKRGWDVLLPKGGIHSFDTRREALDFISRLEVMEPEVGDDAPGATL